MSSTTQSKIARAHCADCEWSLERSLDKAGLSEAKNREIAERVVRSHAYKCPATGDEWGQTATVESEIPGGET